MFSMKKSKWIIIIFSFLLLLLLYFVAFKPASGSIHYENKVAVLEYHDIDPQESTYTITPKLFEQQLQALKDEHYNVISTSDLIHFLNGKKSVPPNAVVLTFDDGYESFYKFAYPILTKEGMTATEFLIVSYLNTNTGIAFLNWNEIKEMNQKGFSFYSHTYNAHNPVPDANGKEVLPLTHPIYLKNQNRVETENEYETRVKNDLFTADRIINEQLDNQFNLLCLPHGDYSDNLLKLIKEEGIQYIFTGNDGLNTVGNTKIKRIIAGAPYVSANKLIQRLDYEPTLYGKFKAFVKNTIEGHYSS